MAGGEHAVLVALGDEHQGPVDRHHLVEEDRDVHRPRLGHAVVARPGAVVLVPLPELAVERRLGVDLELVHVDRLAEQLLERLDQARIGAQQAEGLVVGVGGEGGARRARLLPPDLLALGPQDRLGFGAQHANLFAREALGQKDVALLVELLELHVGQAHRRLLGFGRPCSGGRSLGLQARGRLLARPERMFARRLRRRPDLARAHRARIWPCSRHTIARWSGMLSTAPMARMNCGHCGATVASIAALPESR